MSRSPKKTNENAARSKLPLTPTQKRALYLSSTVLWLSGVLWLCGEYWTAASNGFGSGSHSGQAFWLKVHGAVAMLFLMVFGSLFIRHIPVGWQQRRQRPSGVPLLSVCAVLILTSWSLYYGGNEDVRHWTSLIHWGLGLALPVMIAVHVWLGRRKATHPTKRGQPFTERKS